MFSKVFSLGTIVGVLAIAFTSPAAQATIVYQNGTFVGIPISYNMQSGSYDEDNRKPNLMMSGSIDTPFLIDNVGSNFYVSPDHQSWNAYLSVSGQMRIGVTNSHSQSVGSMYQGVYMSQSVSSFNYTDKENSRNYGQASNYFEFSPPAPLDAITVDYGNAYLNINTYDGIDHFYVSFVFAGAISDPALGNTLAAMVTVPEPGSVSILSIAVCSLVFGRSRRSLRH